MMEALERIDATSPENLQNPYPYYDRLRREAPVFRDPKTGIVSVSTYELVLDVNKKPKIFSSNFAALLGSGGKSSLAPEEEAILAEGLERRDTLLTADPPMHSRYKRIAMAALPLSRINGMAPYIAEVTHALIDRFADVGEVEFKSQVAEMLRGIVVADVLGVALKAGEPLLLRYGSANRDAAKFADPDRFDVSRENVREHIAFGAGVHTCPGMHLARLEMATALPIVLERVPGLRFADPDNPFQFAASHILRGMQTLRLHFDPA
jgi:cytochrome P450